MRMVCQLLLMCFMLLALPMSAQEDRGEARAYFGVMGASEHRVGYSLAMTALKVGPTRSGLLIGYVGSYDRDQPTPANMAYADLRPGVTTIMSQRKGYQVGYFADMGRGFFSVGYEVDIKTMASWGVASDKSITSLPGVETKKSGAYVQIGFRGRPFGAYVHYGSTTGVGLGVSVHFSLK